MTRSPGDDFDHPALPEGHPLRRHVLYRAHSADHRSLEQGLDPGFQLIRPAVPAEDALAVDQERSREVREVGVLVPEPASWVPRHEDLRPGQGHARDQSPRPARGSSSKFRPITSKPSPRRRSYSALSRGIFAVHDPDHGGPAVDQHDLALELGGADDAAFRIREGKLERLADLGPGQDLDPGIAGLLDRPRRRGLPGRANAPRPGPPRCPSPSRDRRRARRDRAGIPPGRARHRESRRIQLQPPSPGLEEVSLLVAVEGDGAIFGVGLAIDEPRHVRQDDEHRPVGCLSDDQADAAAVHRGRERSALRTARHRPDRPVAASGRSGIPGPVEPECDSPAGRRIRMPGRLRPRTPWDARGRTQIVSVSPSSL